MCTQSAWLRGDGVGSGVWCMVVAVGSWWHAHLEEPELSCHGLPTCKGRALQPCKQAEVREHGMRAAVVSYFS